MALRTCLSIKQLRELGLRGGLFFQAVLCTIVGMRPLGSRNTWISVFVIVWIAVFHYETLRLSYLSPLVGHQLPKLKFLYPPAGWIMFFNVDRSYGFAEVYGLKERQPFVIDPHEIFETRFVGYDNIRRNILISVLSSADSPRFCRYLRRKFPDYDTFAVMYGQYPDLIDRPHTKLYQLAYRCP